MPMSRYHGAASVHEEHERAAKLPTTSPTGIRINHERTTKNTQARHRRPVP